MPPVAAGEAQTGVVIAPEGVVLFERGSRGVHQARGQLGGLFAVAVAQQPFADQVVPRQLRARKRRVQPRQLFLGERPGRGGGDARSLHEAPLQAFFYHALGARRVWNASPQRQQQRAVVLRIVSGGHAHLVVVAQPGNFYALERQENVLAGGAPLAEKKKKIARFEQFLDLTLGA